MGKKYELRRLDRFYHQAKTAGYRSRAAYKLIQLNRKYNFLQSARVCIDLCAAPGSWMQVAARYMPPSSVVIGVDRYRIVPIPNTIGLQGDITTEKVRQDLKSNLKTWKADVVLHDGAPHVGQSWLQDAYQQNLLVLHAFKLACEFLRKDGTFVTKIFRSKDHLSLQYVFRKLFKRVEATKPIASRIESAEMFIVCVGFLAPDKIDAEFFDAKYVFETLEVEPQNKINVLKPEKVKRKAEGYQEGITMLFEKKNISEFINSPNYIELLEVANQFEWDLPAAKESNLTTSEIIEFCKDIKVLGRKDLRTLMNWRKAIKEELEENETKKIHQEIKPEEKSDQKDELDEEMEELKLVQEQIAKLQADKEREDKKRQKKLDKRKKKLQDKMNLRLMIPGDPGPQESGRDGLFSLDTLDKVEALDDIVDQKAEMLAESESEEEDSDDGNKLKYYSRDDAAHLDITGTYHKSLSDSDTEGDSGDDDELSSDDEGLRMDKEEAKEEKQKKKVTFADVDPESESEPDDDTAKRNPLVTDLVGDVVADKRERKAESWFSNNIFDQLENDEIEDLELESAIEKYEKYGGLLKKPTKKAKEPIVDTNKKIDASKEKSSPVFNAEDAPGSDSGSDSDSDSDSGVDADSAKDDKDESGKKKKKKESLSSRGLAVATKLIHSKKAKREMIDDSWNKYMWGDEKLPDWFALDEKRFNSPALEVDKKDVAMYEDRSKPVDARTIKKVVEAKARKKRRATRRFKKLRKMADLVTRNPDMTPREKAIEIKKIYKKAYTNNKQKEKKYLVMKRSFAGKRPKGVKGPVKLVDRRLKKDKRAAEKHQKRKSKSTKPQRPQKPKGKKKKQQK